MGISISNTSKLGSGFHERASKLDVNGLVELAVLLGVPVEEAPDAGLYDWLRQRIYDELIETSERHVWHGADPVIH